MANTVRDEIPFLSVAELARLIRAREVSPVEATEAYLERIERIDGQLNSYITVCHEGGPQVGAGGGAGSGRRAIPGATAGSASGGEGPVRHGGNPHHPTARP